MIPILQLKDKNGNWLDIPAIVGPKGDPFTYKDFTPEQLEALRGPQGEPGSDAEVPDWAKQPEKPEYTADEVGAQPAGDYALKSEIPSDCVKSVNGEKPDENGNIEIEVGGEGSGFDLSWKLISKINIENESTTFTITQDDNGQPFSYKEILLKTDSYPATNGYFCARLHESATLSSNVVVWGGTANKPLSVHFGLIEKKLGILNAQRGGGWVELQYERGGGRSNFENIETFVFGTSTQFTSEGTIYLYGR